tara:strand:+ start:1826 stop:3004 length:1179 start_codon:yes stop_codon:yes gene_type:complete
MHTLTTAVLAGMLDTGIGGDDLEFTGAYDQVGRPIMRRRRRGGRPGRGAMHPGRRLYPGHPDAPETPPSQMVVVEDGDSEVGYDDDDDLEGDDDDDEDLLGYDEEIEGDDDDLEGYDDEEVEGELAARSKAADRKLKRLRRRRDRLEKKLDRARGKRRKKRLRRRIKKLNAKIKKLEGKQTKRSKKIAKKKGRRRAATTGRGMGQNLTYSGEVGLYPPGGKQIIIPMEPAAAPVGPDWVGAVGNPLVTALIPGGLITAVQPMQAPQMPWLKYQIVGLLVTEDVVSNAFANDVSGRGLIDNFLVGGGEDLLPVAGMCPIAPWNLENDLPAPALRNNPVVESPNVVTLDLLAAGTNLCEIHFTVSLVANIIEDNLGTRGKKVQKYQMLSTVSPR